MTFDREQYRRDVLDPARKAGNAPPADLFARYALTPGVMSDGTAFTAHLAEVENYWRTLKQKATYRKLAEALLGAHEKLQRTGDLDRDTLRQRRAEMLQRARRRLEELVADLVASSSCITPDTRDQLSGAFQGAIDKGAVNAALRQAGVRVVEPCELPTGPPIAKLKYDELREYLTVLGLRFSAELVLGDALRKGFLVLNGFRLRSGAPMTLDAERLERVRQESQKEAQDELKTAASNAIAILLRAEERSAGTLERLLLWEVISALRPVASISRSQRRVAREAMELGLDAGEADVLALSLVEARADSPANTAVLGVEDALAAGQLRAAQRLAAALRPTDDTMRDLLERLEAAAHQVAELSARAEEARVLGRTEEAARLLAEALRTAQDDVDLQRRLASLPPPPPADVRVATEDERVVIRWQPSAALTGTVRYRVIRGNGHAALTARQGPPLGETDANELTDPEPPVGEPLFYSVFATRDQAWSEAALVGPVIVTPDVAALRLDADVRVVAGSWKVHPRTAEVEVVRTEGRPPRTAADGQLVRLDTLSGFTDTGVRTGVRYFYRVVAMYRTPDGRRHRSPGVVVPATAEAPPVAVTDLCVEMLKEGAELTWTIPPSGTVSIRLSETRPRWPVGMMAAPAELAAFGQPLPGTPERMPDGQARLAVRELRGRRFLTATTSTTSQTLVGNTVELTVGEPVRDLSAERLDEVVRLSWVWPDESTSARVRWWPTGAEGQLGEQTEVLRRAYVDGGGFDVHVGVQAVTVAVQAVMIQVGGDVVSTPVTTDVAGLGTKVRYSIRWVGWPRRKRARLALSAETPCTLPPLLVVRRAGPVMPLSPHQGETVGHIPSQALDPQTPCTIELDVAPVRGPVWLVCFPESESGAAITLIHPPVRELRAG